MSADKKSKKLFFPGILLLLVFCLFNYSHFTETIVNALPQKRKINSVKSLTYMLSKIEKENGNSAMFATLKLQIYLEDIYISQGTTVILHPDALSMFIKKMVAAGKSKDEIATEILRRYQNGDFHD